MEWTEDRVEGGYIKTAWDDLVYPYHRKKKKKKRNPYQKLYKQKKTD